MKKRQLWLHPHEWAVIWQALHSCHCVSHTTDTACVTVGKQEFARLKGVVHPLSKSEPGEARSRNRGNVT